MGSGFATCTSPEPNECDLNTDASDARHPQDLDRMSAHAQLLGTAASAASAATAAGRVTTLTRYSISPYLRARHQRQDIRYLHLDLAAATAAGPVGVVRLARPPAAAVVHGGLRGAVRGLDCRFRQAGRAIQGETVGRDACSAVAGTDTPYVHSFGSVVGAIIRIALALAVRIAVLRAAACAS